MNNSQHDTASTVWMVAMTALIVLSFLSLSSAYNVVMLALIFGCAVALAFQKRKAAKTYGYVMLVLCAFAFLGTFVVRVR